jgi:hypothetical protein
MYVGSDYKWMLAQRLGKPQPDDLFMQRTVTLTLTLTLTQSLDKPQPDDLFVQRTVLSF